MPEAQLRCTVKAGTGRGMPAASAPTRPMLAASAGVPQLPSTTSSSCAGSTSVRARSSETARRPSSAADTSLSGPPDLANGVRTPSTMTTFLSPSAWTAIPKGSSMGRRAPPAPRNLSHECHAVKAGSAARFECGASRGLTRERGSGFSLGVDPRTLIDLYRIGLVDRARDDAFLRKVNGTYAPVSSREALDRITRLCAALIEVGVRPGDRVAILSETRLDWMVTDFAILTAGAATVPVYPSLPAAQVEPLLADSEVVALFCSR